MIPNVLGKRGNELAEFSESLKLHLHVEFSEVVVQNPTGQTAKAQVGTEASRTGIQRARVDPRVLKVGYPNLYRQKEKEYYYFYYYYKIYLFVCLFIFKYLKFSICILL